MIGAQTAFPCEHGAMAGALIALAALFLLAAPTVAHADLQASVVGGELRLSDDPGGSPNIDLVYEPNYYAVPPVPAGPAYLISRFGQTTGVRAGPGCGFDYIRVVCPASGVNALAASLGDGNDSFATAVQIFPPRAPLPFTRVTLDLGPGSDSVQGFNFAQPAVVEIDGGPDDDGLSIGKGMQSVTLRGGDGNDGLGAGAPSGTALLDGGPGNDGIAGTAGRGGLTMLGGEGNDELDGSGKSTKIDAGPGDDILGVKRDRDVDTLVCGTGLDHFSAKPGKGDIFGTDCPPIVQVAKEPGPIYLGGRVPVATQLIGISHPSTVNLILYRVRRGPDEIVARIRGVSAPAGTSRFSLRLTRNAIARFKRLRSIRLTIVGTVKGRGGEIVGRGLTPFSNPTGGNEGPFYPIRRKAGPRPGVSR
jgi:hypothetical protein